MEESSLAPLIVIVGPTGSGKSVFALDLAEKLGGEIVNFDSVQLYRGLDIGSAKLPLRERRGIPHHLIDVAEPATDLTAGSYTRLARPVLSEIARRGRVPILVGGTGFYLRALLNGLSPAPPRNPRLRVRLAALAARRPAALHRFLLRYDPIAAGRIHPNDHQKLMRAIELCPSETRPRDPLQGFSVHKFGLCPDRLTLYQNINRRADHMFRNGLIEETEALLAAGTPPNAKAMQSLGYKQAVQMLLHRMPLAEAIEQCQTKTRHYAKRQLTWFRAEADVTWLSSEGRSSDTTCKLISATLDGTNLA